MALRDISKFFTDFLNGDWDFEGEPRLRDLQVGEGLPAYWGDPTDDTVEVWVVFNDSREEGPVSVFRRLG